MLRRWARPAGIGMFALGLVYLLLLIPENYPEVPQQSDRRPFTWNQDELWSQLEEQFDQARHDDGATLGPRADSLLAGFRALLDAAAGRTLAPEDTLWVTVERAFFSLAPVIAVASDRLSEYVDCYARLRNVVKSQSLRWDMSSVAARGRLYRLLYGSRAAVEEVMLQATADIVPALIDGTAEPSATPAASFLGVTVHSGDILVSRGGAPTSALIARGNDFPGNFSHVALVYVDEQTHEISIIESHIEQGVAVATREEYLADRKLRVLVLRLRADVPQLVADPLVPHTAAGLMLDEARLRHIPYDFAMDFADDRQLFCSEVASAPYRKLGITLWMGLSHLSSPGLRSWLAGFGVRHFVTQEPSDLEYDPQLSVVAEWHDPRLLAQDHLDNAVIDVMLETADMHPQLPYARTMLPVARLSKTYSMILNLCVKIGPVPEGMSAAAALRNVAFSARHAAIKARTKQLTDEFKQRRGYAPPYWVIVQLARQAQSDME